MSANRAQEARRGNPYLTWISYSPFFCTMLPLSIQGCATISLAEFFLWRSDGNSYHGGDNDDDDGGGGDSNGGRDGSSTRKSNKAKERRCLWMLFPVLPALFLSLFPSVHCPWLFERKRHMPHTCTSFFFSWNSMVLSLSLCVCSSGYIVALALFVFLLFRNGKILYFA